MMNTSLAQKKETKVKQALEKKKNCHHALHLSFRNKNKYSSEEGHETNREMDFIVQTPQLLISTQYSGFGAENKKET